MTFRDGGLAFAGFLADLAPEYKTRPELVKFLDHARPLHIDLGPLARWASQEEPDPEEFQTDALAKVARRLGLTAQEYFEREQQRNDHAWQSPHVILTTARELQRISQLGAAETLPFFEFYGHKDLGQDLDDLQRMAAWAIELGERVRLVLT